MRPDRHPLLGLRRSDTVALCERLGVRPLRDPTNADVRFRRNRVRHEVLPLLDDVAGRDVVPLLCRLAELAGSQADLMAALAADVDPDDADGLRDAPPPVAAEAVRRRFVELAGGAHPPDAAAVARVLSVAAGEAVGCEVQGGWSVRRSSGRLRWTGPDSATGTPIL
jgi:tRNA(Ile)-lysidine synthase